MDEATEITVSIPVKQAIQTHVEHLQATLAKRNAEIERLTQRVAEAEAGEPNKTAIDAAFKRGWKAASGHLMEITRKAAADLASVRKDAWEIYLQAEKRD
jgi:hypothetical protein